MSLGKNSVCLLIMVEGGVCFLTWLGYFNKCSFSCGHKPQCSAHNGFLFPRRVFMNDVVGSL